MTDQSISASFWVMVFLQTFGSFDPMPGTGPRKMPSPSVYVPVIIAWSILQLAADVGWRRPASKFGWLMVLVGVVVGPFGKRLIQLTTWVTKIYGPQTNASNSGSTQTPQTTGPI